MGSKPKAQTVGFRYSFDIHGAIGKAVDGLLQIRASGKTAWSGNATTSQTITINAPELFGGDKGEGGLKGRFDLMMGDEAQPVNTKLAEALGGGLVPSFRGFAGFFYSGLVTSINPYPKPWELLRYRRMNGWDGPVWYPETCAIDLAGGQVRAMNPAHILYEVYTNRENGLGIDRSMLDDVAFRAAALKLYNEGFGLCLGWKRSAGTLADFRDQITDHIGAYCGPDRNSGLITLKLIRDDYTVANLPLFDEDTGLLSIEEDETSSALIAPSQLFVEFTDALTGETRRARAVNQAIAQLQGGPSSETKSYPGIPTGDLAARVVQRDMRVKASNLRKYKVKLDRRAASIGPADAFRIRSLKRGIAEVVVRAGRIEDGTLANGAITITALQDVFGLPSASFVAVPPSGYVPPDRTPQAISLRRLMEVPYRELAGQIDPANLALLDVTAAWLSTMAAKPSGLSLSYNVTTRPGSSGAFTDRGTADWCPTAQLVSAMPVSTAPVMVTLTNGVDLDRVTLGQAALLDDEIVRVDAIDLGTGAMTLGRGCADTVPREHAAGARVWFYDTFEGVDETEYSSGVTMQAQLLTNTSSGQLAPGLAGTDSLTLAGRQGRPYPPGRLSIGGVNWPASIVGDVVLAWAHRDRLSQADQLIDTSLGHIGPEAGTTYSCRLLRADTNAVLVSQTGISGTAATLATAYEGQIIAEVWSVRGGIESLQRQRWHFSYLPVAMAVIGDVPELFEGVPFSFALTVTAGQAPIEWSLASGMLPPGVELSTGGVLHGTSQSIGTYAITVGATDVQGFTASRTLELVVGEAPISSAAYADVIMSLSPIGYWRLGETSGTVALDSSGNGQNGTYTGGYTLGRPSLISSDSNDASVGCNGAGYVVVNVPAGTYQLVGTTWLSAIKCTSVTSGDRYVWHLGNLQVNGQQGLSLLIRGGAVMLSYLSGGWQSVTFSGITLATGVEYRIALRINSGTSISLLVNGALIQTVTLPAVLPSVAAITELRIGTVNYPGPYALTGDIDEFAIVPSALTDSEIFLLENAAL